MRRVPVGHRPKEFQGPFPTKKAAEKARNKDSRTYGTPLKDYKIQHLTQQEFERIWMSTEPVMHSRPTPGARLTKITSLPKKKLGWFARKILGL